MYNQKIADRPIKGLDLNIAVGDVLMKKPMWEKFQVLRKWLYHNFGLKSGVMVFSHRCVDTVYQSLAEANIAFNHAERSNVGSGDGSREAVYLDQQKRMLDIAKELSEVTKALKGITPQKKKAGAKNKGKKKSSKGSSTRESKEVLDDLPSVETTKRV
jgi:hypothetical protein